MNRPSGNVLIARCSGASEPDGVPCPGSLRFHWGSLQAACDTCGGWTGISVADWTSVERNDGSGVRG